MKKIIIIVFFLCVPGLVIAGSKFEIVERDFQWIESESGDSQEYTWSATVRSNARPGNVIVKFFIYDDEKNEIDSSTERGYLKRNERSTFSGTGSVSNELKEKATKTSVKVISP